MRTSGHPQRREALLLGGAFLFFCSMVAPAVCLPTAGQGSKTSGSTSSAAKKNTSKPTRKRIPVRQRRVRGQMAPQADRIKHIQAALAKSGHYSGEPSGKWGATSVAALKSFQEANGLKASGKLNARTLQALGLGSPTAGMAAPRKVVAATDEGSSQ